LNRQQAAQRLVDHCFASFIVPDSGQPDTNTPACVLVRCFQTTSYARMPLSYRDAADKLLEAVPTTPDMRCLSLLATRGIKTIWNDVVTSVGHQAIPLPSVEVVRKAPMIARLLEQFDMPIEQVVAIPDASDMMLHTAARSFSIFHIADAVGSPYIPAQDSFVKAYGVRSVVGIGGLLPDGELFALVLFTRVPISTEVAERFQALIPALNELLMSYSPKATFQDREF
jgi:hypothetical protein